MQSDTSESDANGGRPTKMSGVLVLQVPPELNRQWAEISQPELSKQDTKFKT